MKGDCNSCVRGVLAEDDPVCVACGLNRKNYFPAKADRSPRPIQTPERQRSAWERRWARWAGRQKKKS